MLYPREKKEFPTLSRVKQGVYNGKILLPRIIENIKIDAYFRQG